MGSCFICMRFQICKVRIVLRMDGGDRCTTMWMYLIPLNCTLKNGQDGKSYVGVFCHSFFKKQWLKGERVNNLLANMCNLKPACKQAWLEVEGGISKYWNSEQAKGKRRKDRAQGKMTKQQKQWRNWEPRWCIILLEVSCLLKKKKRQIFSWRFWVFLTKGLRVATEGPE